MTMSVNVLRPESRGHIHIKSSSPHDAPHISFNFLSTQIDNDTLLLALRKGRELMSAEPISNYVEEEIAPGNELRNRRRNINLGKKYRGDNVPSRRHLQNGKRHQCRCWS